MINLTRAYHNSIDGSKQRTMKQPPTGQNMGKPTRSVECCASVGTWLGSTVGEWLGKELRTLASVEDVSHTVVPSVRDEH
jgi:phage tail tape-measure protein